MTDLIIGGAGFIGAHLVRELLAEGGDVAVYDRDVGRAPILDLLHPDEVSRLALVAGDVTDAVHLLRTVAEIKPHRIVHLAATLTPAAQSDPATAVRVMTLGTVHVLEAVRLLGLERLVWTSSAQVFGPLDRYRERHGVERIFDDSVPDPTTVYGACKAHAEALAKHYATTWQLDITGLRPCGTLGLGRRGGATFEVFELVKRVARGEPASVRRADWVFPLMHVADVVGALAAALRRPESGDGRAYNLGAIHTTFRQLADLVSGMVPDARIEIDGCSATPTAVLDASGIERDLGFKLQHSLDEAIRELLEDARAARTLASREEAQWQ
jgi:UDP-glucose 4-epimerase